MNRNNSGSMWKTILVVLLIGCAAAALTVLLGIGRAPEIRGDARTDYRGDKPGVVHNLAVADLPQPYATSSVDNGPNMISRPAGAWPQAPEGFKVEQYATGLDNPRLVRTAPNGDLFVAESDPGRVKILRGLSKDGKAEQI